MSRRRCDQPGWRASVVEMIPGAEELRRTVCTLFSESRQRTERELRENGQDMPLAVANNCLRIFTLLENVAMSLVVQSNPRWYQHRANAQILSTRKEAVHFFTWRVIVEPRARIMHETLPRDRGDGRATGQPQGLGPEAYVFSTSQGSRPEDARLPARRASSSEGRTAISAVAAGGSCMMRARDRWVSPCVRVVV